MGIFSKFKRGLQKGAQTIQGAFASVTGKGKLDEDSLLQIEEAFYESDFGVETTEEILDAIREAYRTEKEFRGEDAGVLARTVLRRTLAGSEAELKRGEDLPEVLCLIGVNGSGKTTTCAKLAYRLKTEGRKGGRGDSGRRHGHPAPQCQQHGESSTAHSCSPGSAGERQETGHGPR